MLKVGDRVGGYPGFNNISHFMKGKIIDIDILRKQYLVEYDKEFDGGHEGMRQLVTGKTGHCWWELEGSLKKLKNQYNLFGEAV